jgi:hypothetical protein
MTTEDIILQFFCFIDDQMPTIKKYPQAKLYPVNRPQLAFSFL